MTEDVSRMVSFRSSQQAMSFIGFQTDEDHTEIFSLHQLIKVSHGPNPDAGDGHSSQRLHFVFTTAEVVVLGRRLDSLLQRLLESQLYFLIALPKRYADLMRDKVVITSIAITSLEDKI